MQPKVSVVLVSFNTRDALRRCLDSVFAEAGSLSLEVIVVDNASSDGTVAMLKEAAKRLPRLTVIANDRNFGFARASNQGASSARGEHLLFLNPDTVVSPKAIKRLAEFLDSHPEAGVVAPRILNADGSLQSSCRALPALCSATIEAFQLWRLPLRVFGRHRYAFSTDGPIETQGWVSGACLMIPRRSFLDLGGFDENFFLYYEDADLCLRVKKDGRCVFYLPSATVVHRRSQSSRKIRNEAVEREQESQLYYFRKHVGVLACLTLRFVLVVSRMVKGLLTAFAAKLRGDEEYRAIAKSNFHGMVSALRVRVRRPPTREKVPSTGSPEGRD